MPMAKYTSTEPICLFFNASTGTSRKNLSTISRKEMSNRADELCKRPICKFLIFELEKLKKRKLRIFWNYLELSGAF